MRVASVLTSWLVLAACSGHPNIDGLPDSGVGVTSCDPKQILCKRATPLCPENQVPSVAGSCYGPCVPVEQCACSQASDCPNPDSYTCHLYAHHCGPYVN